MLFTQLKIKTTVSYRSSVIPFSDEWAYTYYYNIIVENCTVREGAIIVYLAA